MNSLRGFGILKRVVDEQSEGALADATDAFLVVRAAEGDLRAFTALLRRYSGTLRHYVERLTRNSADTDDVLQETAVLAWRNLDRIREPDKVRAWLIQTATREALRTVRARSVTVELSDDAAALPGPEVGVDRLDLRQALQNALDALPQQQAQCWVLREFGGYRYSEIADELGIPESTVRGALAQARKTIVRSIGGKR